jgi:hypothetical protein
VVDIGPRKQRTSRSRSATKRSGLAGIGIAVVGLDDLIAMQRAAGRPLDRGDVIALTTPEWRGDR